MKTTEQIERYKEQHRVYRKTGKGVVADMYSSQRGCSRRRGHPDPSYTLKELRAWVTSQPIWIELYMDWVESGFEKDLKPSCDRDNNLLPYTLDNMTLMTWKENMGKGHSYRKVDVRVCISIIGTCIKSNISIEFRSQREAGRNGFSAPAINNCLKGIAKTAGGYTWKYKTEST